MSKTFEKFIADICQACGNHQTRMMDILRAVQEQFGHASSQAINLIAQQVATQRVEVEGVASFYTFLSTQPKGKVVIRLCNDPIDQMAGGNQVAQAFARELGIEIGQTTPDGNFTLEYTPCIGMCDQAPAALINEVVVTKLHPDAARKIVQNLNKHLDPKKLPHTLGDGNNAHPLVNSMVANNIRRTGPVIFDDFDSGQALKNALAMTPAEVIREIKTTRLRGRGGAGFPTGMKWEFTRAVNGKKPYVICNADEGEPGTFKDRVILTECPQLLFDGITVAGYAIGSHTGILYLRGEYAYLRPFLENIIDQRRKQGLLGSNVCGKNDFNFDIRIQMGAGAYICGEETALISSCEGKRGEPKNRPPFPAQKGYLQSPTAVNNVETLCCAARILEKGSGWFSRLGTKGNVGTKLLSISGDCNCPGIYELPLGTKLSEILTMAGADDPMAVLVGGPSGQMVGPQDYHRAISFEDLATGGAIAVFANGRNILEIARNYMDFFVEESCGYCTPCRVGNVLLQQGLEKILAGYGQSSDLDYLQQLSETVKTASRCGLGQTSPNPILTTLKNFRHLYQALIKDNKLGLQPSFDIHKALNEALTITGPDTIHFE
ncbi:MAG: NAD(P)H-dependent oxidoreductase subunit E [Planctomycetota bacterium]|jgi:[NiFe] hydrogenase diaphorase moiety large subunit